MLLSHFAAAVLGSLFGCAPLAVSDTPRRPSTHCTLHLHLHVACDHRHYARLLTLWLRHNLGFKNRPFWLLLVLLLSLIGWLTGVH